MRTAKGLVPAVLLVLAVLWSACNGGNSYNSGFSEGEPIAAPEATSPSLMVDQATLHGSDLDSVLGLGGEPSAMARQPVSYLKEVIPPCVPIEGSRQYPCSEIQTMTPPSAEASNYKYMSGTMLHELPTISDILLGIVGPMNTSSSVAHIVVRGTAKPNTTRCAEYPVKLFSFELNNDLYNYTSRDENFYKGAYYNYCFMDFRINEYIVGEGPPVLSISIYEDAIFQDERLQIGDDYYQEYYDKNSAFEGKEMILFLRPPRTASVESWQVATRLRAVWFIQRVGGEVRAVAKDIDHIVAGYNDHLLSQMDMPLSELISQIKKAAEERTVITGGRIGAHSSLPLLVTDANKLQDYYGAVGAVYEGEGATVLPPPAPGGDEPEQPPTQVGEGQPTVASSPVPGDETSPTTTDDAAPPVSSTTSPSPGDTTAPSPTGTTLPQTDGSEPPATTTQPQVQDTVTSTTSPPSSTGTTEPTDSPQPQTEEATPSTTTTTSAAPVDDPVTTTTIQPQVEDVAPSTTTTTQPPAEDASSTTVAPTPPVDGSGAAATTAPLGEGGAPPDEGGGSGLFDEEPVG